MCKNDFDGELGVCTKSCDTQDDCAAGVQCVAEIPDYNGQPLGSFCMLPCFTDSDCAEIGSDCDDKGQGRYCF